LSHANKEHDNIERAFPDSAGHTGALIRSFDWSSTTLGPVNKWPVSLVTLLRTILSSGFPSLLFWGKDLMCFYNDAFLTTLGVSGTQPVIGGKGDAALEKTLWKIVGPMVERVMASGKPVYMEDQPVTIHRNAQAIETCWSFSYSPAYDDHGELNGVFVTCAGSTRKVDSARPLVSSEQQFRTAIDETDILMMISDAKGNATFFNQCWKKVTGRAVHDLLNLGWTGLMHQDDRQGFLTVYHDAMASREPWEAEFRIINREGKHRWILSKGTPRFTDRGDFDGYVSSGVDITDRKSAEDRLMESEHRLRQLIESAPFPIGVYVGRDMKIALVNQSILDVWGKRRDIIGKTYFEVLPELESQAIYPQLDMVFKTGKPFHARNQKVILESRGELKTFYFNYSFTPLFDTQGNVYGIMNTAADVTDVHLAKQKAEQSERNLRNMVLQAPVAMAILVGPTHVIKVANDMIIDLWGKERKAVMNRPVFEALPDARHQGLEEVIHHVYGTGIPFRANERPVNLVRNGKPETVYLNFVYEPYRNNIGERVGVLAIAVDVTQQVRARMNIEEIVADRTKELADANKNLERSNSELAQFAYIASHDLQEPLRKISTFIELLENSAQDVLDERNRNFLYKIKNSSVRMQALIRDVLTFSQLEKKEDFTDVDLTAVFNGVLEDFELVIARKKATVKWDKLPTVKGISLQMSQLFGNLISNALKFARRDVPLVVNVTCDVVDQDELTDGESVTQYYRITISDNGIGFDPSFASQVFNIFQRLHGKSEFEGTGIGLAICKKIAVNHGGFINAEGSSANGAVFSVYLPREED
jgi:PAS domain S-box-containing protein